MKKAFLFILCFLFCLLYASNTAPRRVLIEPNDSEKGKITIIRKYPLPDLLSETSGLIYYNGLAWTFNDSGGEPEIYAYSLTDSAIVQRLTLWNGKNYDWEEITQDSTHIYVSDIGNNFGNRHSLCIYKINKTTIPGKGNKLIKAEKINFTYPEYKPVPLSFSNRSAFDCEAMVSHNDSLYLFTKDWVHLTTTIYRLPNTPGKYIAQKVGTFNSNGLITAATFFNGTLYLLGHSITPFIWKFNNLQTFNLTNAHGVRYNIETLAGKQTEGIAAIDSRTLLISAERTNTNALLFVVKLK